MNVKQKLLATAVLSSLGAMSGTASAVHLSETGTGEVLLFPYYTVRAVDGNAYNTYLHLTNATDLPKAVKVRFREAKNSREVLDFNVYLSARDEWVAVITPTATGAQINAADNSCTVPTVPQIGAAGEAFRNFQYTDNTLGLNADGAGTTLDRTREGYIEVIEMGVPNAFPLPTGSTFAADVTHTAAGLPLDCPAVVDAWRGNDNIGTGSTFANTGLELDPATGGLFGSSVLINVDKGTSYENEPVALDDFWDPLLANGVHSYPGTESPNLADVNPVSTIFTGLGVTASTWAGVLGNNFSPADAVSAVLMRDRVMNEFSVNPTNRSNTDWVVTFPTKSAYVGRVAAQDNAAITPFTKNFVTDGSGACESIELRYWDREEKEFTTVVPGGVDFSPQLPGQILPGPSLCWETNVVTFKASDAADTFVGLLGSGVQRDIKLDTGYKTGWAQITFDDTNASDVVGVADATALSDELLVPYFGLPVIGYAVKSMTNGNVVNGVLANYGASMLHKASRDNTDN